jgi:hypothetical protein
MRLVADGGSWQPVCLRDAPICERCLASAHIHWLSAPRGYNSASWLTYFQWANAQPGHLNRIGLIDAACADWAGEWLTEAWG